MSLIALHKICLISFEVNSKPCKCQ